MKVTLRYFMLLAVCLIPLTFVEGIKERFLVEVGVFLGVTAAYWIGYVLLEKKRKKMQNDQDTQ